MRMKNKPLHTKDVDKIGLQQNVWINEACNKASANIRIRLWLAQRQVYFTNTFNWIKHIIYIEKYIHGFMVSLDRMLVITLYKYLCLKRGAKSSLVSRMIVKYLFDNFTNIRKRYYKEILGNLVDLDDI